MSMENDNFRRKGIDGLVQQLSGIDIIKTLLKKKFISLLRETFRSYKRIVGDGRRILAFV